MLWLDGTVEVISTIPFSKSFPSFVLFSSSIICFCFSSFSIFSISRNARCHASPCKCFWSSIFDPGTNQCRHTGHRFFPLLSHIIKHSLWKTCGHSKSLQTILSPTSYSSKQKAHVPSTQRPDPGNLKYNVAFSSSSSQTRHWSFCSLPGSSLISSESESNARPSQSFGVRFVSLCIIFASTSSSGFACNMSDFSTSFVHGLM
mmetsp:Transcript_17820/g.36695  ORF Transcript_17820/g.36695 Transcript_17820/m.36695 type:complete len:203 (-) Transcript_17820:196-804(-)